MASSVALFLTIVLLCLVDISVALLRLKNDGEIHGILLLDSVTFPQIVPDADRTVVLMVWNMASLGEYGADSMREDFAHFADKGTREGKGDNMIFAQVPFTDSRNLDIVRRLGMATDATHPRVFLFQPGSNEAIPYPTKNPFNDVALTTFVTKYSDFFLGISGLEPRYDEIAKRFREAHSLEYPALIEEAEAALLNLSGKHLENAQYYIKIMKKIQESGYEFVGAERKRLKKIIDSGKISDEKKHQQQSKLNIVNQFRQTDNEWTAEL